LRGSASYRRDRVRFRQLHIAPEVPQLARHRAGHAEEEEQGTDARAYHVRPDEVI
jgi:hypothetical protein